jgi:PIN domain nuclease of toxin-antitoxin system
LIDPRLVRNDCGGQIVREGANLGAKRGAGSADLSAAHKLPMADAIIYATALQEYADLLTCDAHFEGLPGVVYVAKQA